MLEILQQLIDEWSYLPMDIVQIILDQFSKQKQNSHPEAFKLACSLGNATADKLQRYVCQYFSDIIVASSQDLEESDLADFKSAHKLILQMNAHVPTLLLSVVPLLEEELKVENLIIRQFGTACLGEMFVESGNRIISLYPSTWQSWIDRRNDKQAVVRSAWIEYAVLILQRHTDIAAYIQPLFIQKLMDPDEKIRIAVIKSFIALSSTPHCISSDMLRELSARCRDKKISVRSEAIDCLGSIFKKLRKSQHDTFSWIPGSILELLYLGDNDTIACVERELQEHILPPEADDFKRTEHLIHIVSDLNEKQFNAFASVIMRQAQSISDFSLFINTCISYNVFFFYIV
jgi:sister-chromatid-cohesion protein PDS5